MLDLQSGALRTLAAGSPFPGDALLQVRRCLACEVADAAAARSPDGLLARVRAGAGMPPAATCCQPHLRRLTAGLSDDPVLPSVLLDQARTLERRADDMRRLALKQDASLRDLISDEERRARTGGVAALVGAPGADRLGQAGGGQAGASPRQRIGALAAAKLLSRLAGEDGGPRRVDVGCQLVVRGST